MSQLKKEYLSVKKELANNKDKTTEKMSAKKEAMAKLKECL